MDISGCSVVSDYDVKSMSPFLFYCIFPSCYSLRLMMYSCTEKLYKKTKKTLTEQQQLDKKHLVIRHQETEISCSMSDHFLLPRLNDVNWKLKSRMFSIRAACLPRWTPSSLSSCKHCCDPVTSSFAVFLPLQ